MLSRYHSAPRGSRDKVEGVKNLRWHLAQPAMGTGGSTAERKFVILRYQGKVPAIGCVSLVVLSPLRCIRHHGFLSVTLRAKRQWECPDLPAGREKCGVHVQQFGAAFSAASQTWQRRQSVEQFFYRLRWDDNRMRAMVRHDGSSLPNPNSG